MEGARAGKFQVAVEEALRIFAQAALIMRRYWSLQQVEVAEREAPIVFPMVLFLRVIIHNEMKWYSTAVSFGSFPGGGYVKRCNTASFFPASRGDQFSGGRGGTSFKLGWGSAGKEGVGGDADSNFGGGGGGGYFGGGGGADTMGAGGSSYCKHSVCSNVMYSTASRISDGQVDIEYAVPITETAPSLSPSNQSPASSPSSSPTAIPSALPTVLPSELPTAIPSPLSSAIPSAGIPSTQIPTQAATVTPTGSPTPLQICQYSSFCRVDKDCVPGNKCYFHPGGNGSQCLPDPTSYLWLNCLPSRDVTRQCDGRTRCCDPGALCNSERFRQCAQPVAPFCASPSHFSAASSPTVSPSLPFPPVPPQHNFFFQLSVVFFSVVLVGYQRRSRRRTGGHH